MDMDNEIESIDNQSEEVAVAQLDEVRKRDFLVAPRRLSIANVFRLLPASFMARQALAGGRPCMAFIEA